MRQTGWYRVNLDGDWDFAFYDAEIKEFYLCKSAGYYFEDQLEINEELQNPEPPKKTGLDGDGHSIEVK